MKKLLSIDGGGVRGIIPATLLARISEKVNKPIHEYFDLIAGTSTGGLIALCMANGMCAEEVQNFYLHKIKSIFKDTILDNFKDGFGKNLGADYDPKNLERILKVIFKNRTLGDIKLKKNCTVLVPAFDISPVRNGKPANFKPKVYNSHSADYQNEMLVDIACRTTAAPTYFPIREKKFIDGGVAINHPAMAAVAFAINRDPNKGLNYSLDELKVLSLGTGTSNKTRIDPKKVGDGNWGIIKWLKYLPWLLTESNVQATEYYIRQVLNIDNRLDKHYLRIQPQLKQLIELDTLAPKSLNYLLTIANKIPIEPIVEFLEEKL